MGLLADVKGTKAEDKAQVAATKADKSEAKQLSRQPSKRSLSTLKRIQSKNWKQKSNFLNHLSAHLVLDSEVLQNWFSFSARSQKKVSKSQLWTVSQSSRWAIQKCVSS